MPLCGSQHKVDSIVVSGVLQRPGFVCPRLSSAFPSDMCHKEIAVTDGQRVVNAEHEERHKNKEGFWTDAQDHNIVKWDFLPRAESARHDWYVCDPSVIMLTIQEVARRYGDSVGYTSMFDLVRYTRGEICLLTEIGGNV